MHTNEGQRDRVVVIYEGANSLIWEIQRLDMDTTLAKMEDNLLEAQGPLEEINIGTK